MLSRSPNSETEAIGPAVTTRPRRKTIASWHTARVSSMTNDDDGFFSWELMKRGENKGIGLAINRVCSFIQDKDGGVAGEGSSNPYSLTVASRQAQTPGPDERI